MNRDESLAMMKEPERWPLGSRLPLVHERVRIEGLPALGFLVAGLTSSLVFLGNVDQGLLEIPSHCVLRYASFEAIVDDGWRVD